MGNNTSSSNNGGGGDGGFFYISWRANEYHYAEQSFYRFNPPSTTTTNGADDLFSCNALVHYISSSTTAAATESSTTSSNKKIAVLESKNYPSLSVFQFTEIMKTLRGAIAIVFLSNSSNNNNNDGIFTFSNNSSSSSNNNSTECSFKNIPILKLRNTSASTALRQALTKSTTRLFIGLNNNFTVVSERLELHDDNPSSMIITACRTGNVKVLKSLLLQAKTKCGDDDVASQAYCYAVLYDHMRIIEVLHDHRFNIAACTRDTKTNCLMVACINGNVEAVRVILTFVNPASIIEAEDAHGMTCLMYATSKRHAHIVKILLAKGASTSLSRNRSCGTTALHIGAQRGSLQCVKTLLCSNNTNQLVLLNQRSLNGSTALMEAARAGYFDIVKFIVEEFDNKVELQAVDKNNKTAADIARDSGFDSIKEYLLENALCLNSDTVQRVRVSDIMNRKSESRFEELLSDIVQNSECFDIVALGYQMKRHYNDVLVSHESVLTVFSKMFEEDIICSKMQLFCKDIALWYSKADIIKNDDKNIELYVRLVFNHLVSSVEDLQDIVFFNTMVMRFIKTDDFDVGRIVLRVLSSDSNILHSVIRHIGYDSIRDLLVWILYCYNNTNTETNTEQQRVISIILEQILAWQRPLSKWNNIVGTSYQRDSVENLCFVIRNIIFRPSFEFMLLREQRSEEETDNYYLLERFLDVVILDECNYLAQFVSIGLCELNRYCEKKYPIRNGGCLSIVSCLLERYNVMTSSSNSKLHKAVFDIIKPAIVQSINTRELHLRTCESANVLFTTVSFIKLLVTVHDDEIEVALASERVIPFLLSGFKDHPHASMLHHEITDVLRVVLLQGTSSKISPVLASCFENGLILNFILASYDSHTVEYRGHMTTLANSIVTLSSNNIVRVTAEWEEFVATKLLTRNLVERTNLGTRHAPLCQGCLELKERANDVIVAATTITAGGDDTTSRYAVDCGNTIETIVFHKNNGRSEKSLVYKKNKECDHIPIPHVPHNNTTSSSSSSASHSSSFIPFPVPMPFHALTFTKTFMGICVDCHKIWYCDNFENKIMKWVIPTSVSPWYSFGKRIGGCTNTPRNSSSTNNNTSSFGLQFKTRGYKSFIILVDTWGRQASWIQSIEYCIKYNNNLRVTAESAAIARAIEIDNEVEDLCPRRLKVSLGGRLQRDQTSSSLSSSFNKLDVKKRFGSNSSSSRRKSSNNSSSLGPNDKLRIVIPSDEDDHRSDITKTTATSSIRTVLSASDLKNIS